MVDAHAVNKAAGGLAVAMLMVEEFHKKNHVAQLQRLPEVAKWKSDQLEHAAATLSCVAEQLGSVMHDGDRRLLRGHLIVEETAELLIAMQDGDEEKTLDALADLLYVLLGTAVTLDLPLPVAFVEVHRSNMTKQRQDDDPQGARVRDKGPSYDPPKIEHIIRLHRDGQVRAEHDFDENEECRHCGAFYAAAITRLTEEGTLSCDRAG